MVWVDADGNIQKSYIPLLDIRMFRTTKENALAMRDAGQFERQQMVSIPLSQKMDKASDARTITYRVRSELGSQDFKLIPSTDFQVIASRDLQSAQVVVSRPELSQSAVSNGGPEDFLKPSEFLQTNDPRIIELAETFVTTGDSTLPEAARLCQGVFQSIRNKNLSQGFQSAAQVARQLEGDCTEHAVLLAAVARVRNIPARAVCGLVYSEQGDQASMGYHMWNELWIDGKWIPADATTGQFPASPNRIAVRHLSLNDANPYGEILESMKILAKLQVQVEKIDY
jgi:hypothetical protein